MIILKSMFRSLLIPAFILTLIGVSSPVLAGAPNLWWKHIKPTDLSQSECLDRAEALLKDNKAGKTKVVDDSVLARNETTNLVVECLSSNGDTEIVVIIAGSDFKEGHKLYSTLVKGFQD